jgi:hypothetical protein
MVRVMHEEHSFSDVFLKFLLVRGMRTQARRLLAGWALSRRSD